MALLMKSTLSPLFDGIDHLSSNEKNVLLPSPDCTADFTHTLQFLKSYTGSLGTFTSYRRETERLLQWTWHIKKATLPDLKREDIEQFVRFCQSPPPAWTGLHKVRRYREKEGLRQPNPLWRPFVAHVSKSARKHGAVPEITDCLLSQGSTQEIFAILSTFFNFLIAEGYLQANPVALIRQKSKFIRKQQKAAPIRRLSLPQWQCVMQAAEELAMENPDYHERTRFILTLLFGMYLRISELAASPRWIPSMHDFAKDSHDQWWFTTVGKGNKQRQIAVSDAMLESLIRWRHHLGLPSLPSAADNSPLIPKMRGHGPMQDTAPLRRLVQQCFDKAAQRLRATHQPLEADTLEVATVHWLRHTGISEDVRIRPREHVRDDAGHGSSATTDRYIDVEKQARHRSARRKTLEIDE